MLFKSSIILFSILKLITTLEINIREVCSDKHSEKLFPLSKTWTAKDECAKFTCRKLNLPQARNELFAVAVKHACIKWKRSDLTEDHCKELKMDVNLGFTVCCQVIVCAEGSELALYGTDPSGDPKIIRRTTHMYLLNEISQISFGSTKK